MLKKKELALRQESERLPSQPAGDDCAELRVLAAYYHDTQPLIRFRRSLCHFGAAGDVMDL